MHTLVSGFGVIVYSVLMIMRILHHIKLWLPKQQQQQQNRFALVSVFNFVIKHDVIFYWLVHFVV